MQKVLAEKYLFLYTLGMKEIKSLQTSEVSEIQFIEIVDRVDSNWADWLVEFEFEGETFEGYMGACPFHPDAMNDSTIEQIEKKQK